MGTRTVGSDWKNKITETNQNKVTIPPVWKEPDEMAYTSDQDYS